MLAQSIEAGHGHLELPPSVTSVWEDSTANGIQDAGEPGVAGVTVTLQTPTGILTTTTMPWVYTFTNLISGTYSLTFTAPSGYQWTPILIAPTPAQAMIAT